MKYKDIILVSLLFIISVSLYMNTLENGFVFDDEFTIVKNTFIKSSDNLSLLFNKDFFVYNKIESSYRPIVTLSYMMDYKLYGLEPRGYHLTNILLHGANVMLIYILISSMLKGFDKLAVFFISLLFAVHPALTEAVNSISFREDLLATLFFTATFALYLRIASRNNSLGSSEWPIYLLSCVTFALALLSKEMALTLPLILHIYRLRFGPDNNKSWKRLIIPDRFILGYLLILLSYLYLRFYLLANPDETYKETMTFMQRMATLPSIYAGYIKPLIFPFSLSADHILRPVNSVFSISFVMPFLILTLLLIYAVHYDKGHSGLGILFFLLSLIPVSNIIPISHPLSERFLYLPAFGFTMTAGLFMMSILEGGRSKHMRLIIYMSLIMILLFFADGVLSRNAIWKDNHILWADTIKKMPESSSAHYGLGNVYYQSKQWEDSLKEFNTSIIYAVKRTGKVDPGSVKAYNSIGDVFIAQNLIDDALRQYTTVTKLFYYFPDGHNSLGVAYYLKGRYDDAVREYKIAAMMDPLMAEAHFNLGLAYVKQGRFKEAVEAWEKTLRIDASFRNAREGIEMLRKKGAK